jgi:polar amino acid transport system permease protein
MNVELLARYGPRMLDGLLVTVELVVLSVAFGAVLAMPIAFARLSQNRFLRALSFGYVYFFRGTPILAQLFLVYYGSGQFRWVFEAIGLWWFRPRGASRSASIPDRYCGGSSCRRR